MKQPLYYFDARLDSLAPLTKLNYDTATSTLYIMQTFGDYNESVFIYPEYNSMLHKCILGYGYDINNAVLFLKNTELPINNYIDVRGQLEEKLIIPIEWKNILNIVVDKDNHYF